MINFMDRGAESIDQISRSVLFTLIPTLFEAALVTTIFFKLGTPAIAVTIFITVICYFDFTFSFTSFRFVSRLPHPQSSFSRNLCLPPIYLQYQS